MLINLHCYSLDTSFSSVRYWMRIFRRTSGGWGGCVTICSAKLSGSMSASSIADNYTWQHIKAVFHLNKTSHKFTAVSKLFYKPFRFVLWLKVKGANYLGQIWHLISDIKVFQSLQTIHWKLQCKTFLQLSKTKDFFRSFHYSENGTVKFRDFPGWNANW